MDRLSTLPVCIRFGSLPVPYNARQLRHLAQLSDHCLRIGWLPPLRTAMFDLLIIDYSCT
jgi:hypothetical protein